VQGGRSWKVDDLDKAFNIDQRQDVFDAAVVTAANAGVLTTRAEQDSAPRDTDPLTGAAAIAAVEEDHLHAPPMPVDQAPTHGGYLI
jgi:hypothetical protein